MPKSVDMPKKNLERAKWAENALVTFGKDTGTSFDHEPDSALGDFLADLMHLCDREGISFEEMLDKGRRHYASEATCCICGKTLTAKDSADDCDNACKKCEKRL